MPTSAQAIGSAKGNAPLTRSMDKKTVGILGLGRIGQAIADKLAPWDDNGCLSRAHEKRCALSVL